MIPVSDVRDIILKYSAAVCGWAITADGQFHPLQQPVTPAHTPTVPSILSCANCSVPICPVCRDLYITQRGICSKAHTLCFACTRPAPCVHCGTSVVTCNQCKKKRVKCVNCIDTEEEEEWRRREEEEQRQEAEEAARADAAWRKEERRFSEEMRRREIKFAREQLEWWKQMQK